VVHLSPQILKHRERPLTLEEVIGDLVRDGLLTEVNAKRLLEHRTKESVTLHPLVAIANQKPPSAKDPRQHLHLEGLTLWLAKRANVPYMRIDPLKVKVEAVTSVVSRAYATRFKILPVHVDPRKVVIATAEPYVREWEEELGYVLRRQIDRVLVNPLEINRYLSEFYGLSHSIRGAANDRAEGAISGITNLEQLVELGRAGKLDANDQHIVNIVDWLLQYAFDQRASDIHLEPRREVGNVRFRIDGVLHLVTHMPSPVLGAVTSRIKALGRMDVVEKRRPQDGRIKTKTPNGSEVELRLSSMPTAFGEKLVMRIFDPDVLTKSPTELGFSRKDTERWQAMVGHAHGIVLVTGPTGSGKTTTLYSTLKQLARPELNLCTVEEPIEMIVPDFNQMQVQHNIGLDFASGVRTLLRQDPDIIMVGEIRDLETAQMAIQASLTGHLVLSTLHTNDAASALTRLLDIGVPAYLINATLIGVVAQRLVRTLCPHCKREGALGEAAWEALTRPWRIPPPETVSYPKGCLECRKTGYIGRSGLYEILTVTSEQHRLIRSDCDVGAIREQGLKDGMEPLRISGARKVAAGLTVAEEVFHVAPGPEEL
jgi:general secretion pathway protein E